MKKYLKVEDLAYMFTLSSKTIDEYTKQGIFPVCDGFPDGIKRYDPDSIEKKFACRLERTSPLFLKKVEAERDMYKSKCERYLNFINTMFRDSSAIISDELVIDLKGEDKKCI